jgi:hypothetical protein
MDIAEGGAFIMIATSGGLGSRVCMRFLVGETRCEANGQVSRFVPTPEGIGIGVAFHHRNEPFAAFLRNLTGAAQVERHKFLKELHGLQIFIDDPGY